LTPTESDSVGEQVDAQGLNCPEPIMMLHAAIRRVAPGECVQLLATDPSTQRDVANFCRFLGHELVVADRDEQRFVYLIRKSDG